MRRTFWSKKKNTNFISHHWGVRNTKTKAHLTFVCMWMCIWMNTKLNGIELMNVNWLSIEYWSSFMPFHPFNKDEFKRKYYLSDFFVFCCLLGWSNRIVTENNQLYNFIMDFWINYILKVTWLNDVAEEEERTRTPITSIQQYSFASNRKSIKHIF